MEGGKRRKRLKGKKLTRSFLPMRPGLADHFVLTRHRTPTRREARSASATNCSLSHEKRSSFGLVRVATPCGGGRRDARARRVARGARAPTAPPPPLLPPLPEASLLPAAASRGSTNRSSSSSPPSEKEAAAAPLSLLPAPEPGE